jgi:outer membrane protein assembly factor BamE (lipoprotein component of BamABCDE complex)
MVVFIAGAARFLAWESNRSPVKLSTLRQLKPGATQENVKRLFGTPQDVHDLYGDHRWCYYRTNSARIVYVIFDTNLLYKGYELDD